MSEDVSIPPEPEAIQQADAVPEPPHPGRTGRPGLAGFAGGLAGGVFVILVAAGAIAAGWPTFSALLQPKDTARAAALDDLARRVAALEQASARTAASNSSGVDYTERIADLDRRVGMLEQQAHAPAADPRIAGLAQKIDQLATDVTNLRNSQPDQGTLARLTERAEAAAQTARDIATQRQSAEALLLAVGQLRDAVGRGDPYETELAAARQLAPLAAESALDTLAPDATTGVPRRERLVAEFPPLANAIVHARAEPESGDLWQRLRQEATTLVSVRRIDGKGEGTAAVVARAEAAAKDGDLAKAVRELGTLSGAPADAAKDWIASAKSRIAADQALSQLSAETAAAIGAKKAGG